MSSRRIKLAIGAFVVPIGLLAACSSERRTETPPVSASPTGSDADNSARNAKDRSGSMLTPMDQGSSEADRTVTQMVRKSVVDQDGFSVNAKNVKIITQDGVVTLRGPVATAEEKAQIGVITAKAAGVKRVDNQLEVETKP
jgi:hyperosmotically inducible protein